MHAPKGYPYLRALEKWEDNRENMVWIVSVPKFFYRAILIPLMNGLRSTGEEKSFRGFQEG